MSRLLSKLTFAAFRLLGASLACVLVAQHVVNIVPVVRAQDKKPSGLKSVEIWTPDPRFPVRIFNIRLGKERVEPAWDGIRGTGAPFPGDANWLANLSFSLRNQTALNIVYLYVAILFPDAGEEGGRHLELPIVFRSKQGVEISTEDPESRGEAHNAPFLFAPGAEMRISLGDYYGQITRVVEARQPLSSISSVWVGVGEVVFEGGRLT